MRRPTTESGGIHDRFSTRFGTGARPESVVL
jgi:hypothetical protein